MFAYVIEGRFSEDHKYLDAVFEMRPDEGERYTINVKVETGPRRKRRMKVDGFLTEEEAKVIWSTCDFSLRQRPVEIDEIEKMEWKLDADGRRIRCGELWISWTHELVMPFASFPIIDECGNLNMYSIESEWDVLEPLLLSHGCAKPERKAS